jgi:hypothetical protein
MVDDPEKQYKKHDLWETDQTRGKKRERTKEVEETFASRHTYPNTNM